VAVTPIEARCRRCGETFHLFEVTDQRRSTCPRCGWMLTSDSAGVLLSEAARADFAQRHLVGALRRLRSIPGNVAPLPHAVLRNLFEEVGWQQDLAEDPKLLREELQKARRLLEAWERLDAGVADTQPRRGWLRRAADRLRRGHPQLGAREDAVGVF
jgi:hypothetical protein